MRAGDDIVTADARQIRILEKAKKQAYTINRYVNPIWLLGVSFALAFGTLKPPLDNNPAAQVLIQQFGERNVLLFFHLFLGSFMGILGAIFGWSIMQWQDYRLIWIRATSKDRVFLFLMLATAIVFTVRFIRAFSS